MTTEADQVAATRFLRSHEAQVRRRICAEKGHDLTDDNSCRRCGVRDLPTGYSDDERAELDRRIAKLRASKAGAATDEPRVADTYGHRLWNADDSRLPDWHRRRTFADLRREWRDMTDRQAAAIDAVERVTGAIASYKPTRGVLLVGAVGTGKTSIIAAGAVRLHEPTGCKWWDADQMFTQAKREMDKPPDGKRVLDWAAGVKTLFLDGLYPLGRTWSEWELERIRELVERRYNRHGVLIASTNVPKHTITRNGAVVRGLDDLLGPSAFSRLQERCELILVDGPDRRLDAADAA